MSAHPQPARPDASAASTDVGADQAVVAAVLARDRKATAELVARHADAVYSYIRHRLVPRVDLVDDLVQDVFVAALKGLHAFAGRSSLRAWLLGIARHKVEDHYRARLRSATVDEIDDTAVVELTLTPRFEERLDKAKLHEKTRRVLATLPETYGYALLWRYWERRSVREIAAQTGRTEKAAERLLARARHQFKQRWLAD